jgi:hypothetical protein
MIAHIPNLPPQIAQRAMAAMVCTVGHLPRHLLIADMSQPSSHKRLWILDLSRPGHPQLLGQTRVAHGAGSDPDKTGLPERFGNAVNGGTTSLGLYRIAESYTGKHGKSYRLDGLTPGFDDQARTRAVVLHPAPYVTENHVGRSLGCPAINPEVFTYFDRLGAFQDAYLWIDGPGAPQATCQAAVSPWPTTNTTFIATTTTTNPRSCTGA